MIRVNSLSWRLTTEETETAIGILKQAVERFPDYAPAHSMLAFSMRRTDEAAEQFHRALTDRSDSMITT